MVNYNKLLPTQARAMKQAAIASGVDLQAFEVIAETILPKAVVGQKFDLESPQLANAVYDILKSRGWNIGKNGQKVEILKPRSLVERFYRSLPLPSNYEVYWSNWTLGSVLAAVIVGVLAPMCSFGAFPPWVGFLATGFSVFNIVCLVAAGSSK